MLKKTACADACFRDYDLIMVKDCVYVNDDSDNKSALRNVEKLMGKHATKSLSRTLRTYIAMMHLSLEAKEVASTGAY